jgi:hypothetical protein
MFASVPGGETYDAREHVDRLAPPALLIRMSMRQRAGRLRRQPRQKAASVTSSCNNSTPAIGSVRCGLRPVPKPGHRYNT